MVSGLEPAGCGRPYWLYLQESADSPWYSSMRLFHQPRYGDWDSVFASVKSELAALAQEK